jgi:hypothetical protein
MLGVVIFSTNYVVAMEGYVEGEYQDRQDISTVQDEKTDRSKLKVLDIQNLQTLDVPEINSFYVLGYKNGYVKTPVGEVHKVEGINKFQATAT